MAPICVVARVGEFGPGGGVSKNGSFVNLSPR
jgi:hypothetical protein